MKIYHKRSFAGGILCLLLAAGCGALLAAEGFQVKLLVSLALLLFLGGVDLVWAMSRESRMPRGDERDRQISEKSAWSAYLVLTNGCWMVSVVVLLLYAVFRSVALLAAAVPLFCVILAAFVILLCTNAYYERHL